jgi:5-methyltetrahydrofolate--homocysteine methyltransferase
MLEAAVEETKALCREGWMTARAVRRWLPARRDGDAILVLAEDGARVLARLDFPRQRRGEGLCLADYVVGEPDHLGLFVTTAGEGIRERVGELREAGRYLESHVLGALAVETAEAAAEWLHARMREEWGIPDPPGFSFADALAARYRGQRYSFGYPACPDLSAQETLFALLGPAEIGVHLTEGHMMDPEASVSALVFHHPEARYFSVGASP